MNRPAATLMTLAGVAALVVGGARVGSGSAVRNEDVRVQRR